MSGSLKEYQLYELVGNSGAFTYRATHLASGRECMIHMLAGDAAMLANLREDVKGVREAAHASTPFCIQCGTPIPVAVQQYAPQPQYQQGPPQAPMQAYAHAAPAIPYANFALRFIALIVDEFIALTAASFAFGMVVGVGLLLALVGVSTQSDAGMGGGILAGLAAYFIATPLAIVVYVLYFVKFETGPQQATPGKMMVGIRLVDATTGQTISVGQSIGRLLIISLFSGWFCCIGFLMALFTEKKQALHDLVAGTLGWLSRSDWKGLQSGRYARRSRSDGACAALSNQASTSGLPALIR